VKASFEAMVRDLGAGLTSHARECGSDGAEGRALAALALCVGGLGLARSVQDEALAKRILESCREQARNILCGGSNPAGKAEPRRGRKPS
jgi:TetR/AcrR family transcriptional repressor of nem operon